MKDRDAVTEQDLEDRLRRERRQDVEIVERNLILRSPNGTRWKLVIGNDGVVRGEAL